MVGPGMSCLIAVSTVSGRDPVEISSLASVMEDDACSATSLVVRDETHRVELPYSADTLWVMSDPFNDDFGRTPWSILGFCTPLVIGSSQWWRFRASSPSSRCWRTPEPSTEETGCFQPWRASYARQ